MKDSPSGQLVIQTVAMPADLNAYGDIFGGWVLSQMDLGGSVMAHQHAKCRVVTVAIDRMAFLRPVNVGDSVCCYAELEKKGNTSMTIKVETWVVKERDNKQYKVTEGLFTFVAIDDVGKPKPIAWNG